jgi:hypothetical protein
MNATVQFFKIISNNQSLNERSFFRDLKLLYRLNPAAPGKIAAYIYLANIKYLTLATYVFATMLLKNQLSN